MKIVKKKLSELHPLEKNVRRHSPKQISEYVRSLNMFEQLRPLVIDEDGTIWIGNGMFEAMKSMGWEYAECEIRRGLTEKQKKKMRRKKHQMLKKKMFSMKLFAVWMATWMCLAGTLICWKRSMPLSSK